MGSSTSLLLSLDVSAGETHVNSKPLCSLLSAGEERERTLVWRGRLVMEGVTSSSI